jgi:large subunit ribosomal protein L35
VPGDRREHIGPNGSISAPSVRGHQQGKQKTIIMPKVKTHSRAKKTFKVTGTGKISFRKPYRGHLLTKKSKGRKRALRVEGQVHKTNLDFVKRLLRLK